MNIFNDNDKRYKLAEKLLKNKTFHCYKCGYVLINLRPEAQGTIWDKCTNSSCRAVNRFIKTKGKLRLLTAKILDKMDEEELKPYSKSDILELVLE